MNSNLYSSSNHLKLNKKENKMKIATLNIGHQNYKKIIKRDGNTAFLVPTKEEKNDILQKALEDTISSIENIFKKDLKIDVLALTEVYVAVLYNKNFIKGLEKIGLTSFSPKCNHCHSTYTKNQSYLQLSTCLIMSKDLAKEFQIINAEIMPGLFPVIKNDNQYDCCTARECRISSNKFDIVSVYIPAGFGSQKDAAVKSLEKLLYEMQNNFGKINNKKYIYLGDFNLIIPHFEDTKRLEEYKTKYPKSYFSYENLLKEFDAVRKTNDTWRENYYSSTYGSEKIDYIFSSQFKSTMSSVYSIDPKYFTNKEKQKIQIGTDPRK